MAGAQVPKIRKYIKRIKYKNINTGRLVKEFFLLSIKSENRKKKSFFKNCFQKVFSTFNFPNRKKKVPPVRFFNEGAQDLI